MAFTKRSEKTLYLNQAEGIVLPKLKALKRGDVIRLSQQFQRLLRGLLNVSNTEFLGSSQNATSSLIYSLLPILQNRQDFQIFISAHEIKWFKTLFTAGRLPVKETTYPNYAPQKKINFIKKKVTVFDPYLFIKNPRSFVNQKIPAIVILSHVSRLTGELFVTPGVYRKIKALNKANILVVDGSQAVGAMRVDPHIISDIYIGVTSKFINAEPHISFYWVSQQIADTYGIISRSINPRLFFREIYSAVNNLKILQKNTHNVHAIRKYFETKLKEYKINFLKYKYQQDHIILIPEKRSKLGSIIKKLKRQGIIISPNTSYSIQEPKDPALRISITPRLKISDINYFVDKMAQIKHGLR